MSNTTYENKNPCIGCKISWCAEGSLSCHDTCEKYQFYRDRQALKKYNHKMKPMCDSELKGEKLDEMREKFFDIHQDLDCWEMRMIYKVFEFIKKEQINKCGCSE